jgi:hypothetical protein
VIGRAQQPTNESSSDIATNAGNDVKASTSRWRMLPLIVMTLALGAATVMLWSIQQTPEPSPVSWQESRANTFSAQQSGSGGAAEMLSHEPAGDDEPTGNDAAFQQPNVAPQRTTAPSTGVGPGVSTTVNQTMQTILQQSLSPVGQQMSDQEPADLRPIESGRRISGFVRTQSAVTETFSVWEVTDVSIEQAIAHYDTQARSAGFVAIKTPAAGGDPAKNDELATRRLVTYTRAAQPSQGAPDAKQTLSIRVQRYDELTRVTLWLRQPSSQKTSQPPVQPPAQSSVQSQPGAIR